VGGRAVGLVLDAELAEDDLSAVRRPPRGAGEDGAVGRLRGQSPDAGEGRDPDASLEVVCELLSNTSKPSAYTAGLWSCPLHLFDSSDVGHAVGTKGIPGLVRR
jgi:hypothetical protein